MKKIIILSIIILTFSLSPILNTGDITILPNGVLENGDKAFVTGDYVRIRSGPSLENRILTKVNKETLVTIIKRGDTVVNINGMKNYWYNIKVEKSGIEGWMFGEYLNKKVVSLPIPQEKVTPPPAATKQFVFKELGAIEENPSLISTGDLNLNGVDEIIFINTEERKRYSNITGYESEENGFESVYTTKINVTDINDVKIFNLSSFDISIIAIYGNNFSSLYRYDKEKNVFILQQKIASPMVSIALLDGQAPYLIYLRKNRVIDIDGTITYFLNTAKMEMNRDRISLTDKLEYQKALPIKKLIAFDLNNNKKEEIICEIGGKEFGGGITVFSLADGKITRLLNTGVNTYKDDKFVGMWGAQIENTPKLILYTTDPSHSNDVNTSFGFLYTTFNGKNIIQEKFYSVNRMLDDINNGRKVKFYKTKATSFPFIIIDFNQDTKKYTIKTPTL